MASRRRIKLFKPYVSWRSIWNVFKVLRSSQLAEGPMVKRFEEDFAKKFNLNSSNCVALNSGTAALELAYELAKVGPGDEVIVPVMTMIASGLPGVRRGAKIVFTDITEGFLMDPNYLKKKITSKTKAIVYVDFGGASNTLEEVADIAREHSLTLIQDSAQSVGPYFKPMGDYVCLSFQAIKTLTCGDGGMLITKDNSKAVQARLLRWFGIDRERKQREGDVDVVDAGYKYHMNDVDAAIGLGNLYALDSVVRRRKRISDVYRQSGLPILTYPWLAIFVHPRALEVMNYLKEKGIDSGQSHYRNDKYTVFGGRRNDLPMMDKLENSYTLLPYHHAVTTRDAVRITNEIKNFLASS